MSFPKYKKCSILKYFFIHYTANTGTLSKKPLTTNSSILLKEQPTDED